MTEYRYCHHCNLDKPPSQVINGYCLQCRADAVSDERPVSALLSGLFRTPKPHPQKKVGRAVERA